MKFKLALVTLFAASAMLSGCGTNTGTSVANFLESPTNAKILSAASQAGAAAIANSTGKGLTPEQNQALAAAVAPTLSGVGTGVVWAIGEALRSKQGTTDAAKAVPVSAAVSIGSGAPASVANPVAVAVSKLAELGIPANVANEAVAVAVQSVASARDGKP